MSILIADPTAEWKDRFRKLYLDAVDPTALAKVDLVVQEFLNKTEYLKSGRVGVAIATLDATAAPIAPGIYPLGELLPAGVIITRTFLDVVAPITGVGGETIDFGILAPADLYPITATPVAPGVTDGLLLGLAATMIKLPTALQINLNVLGGSIVGLAHLFCEYVYSTI